MRRRNRLIFPIYGQPLSNRTRFEYPLSFYFSFSEGDDDTGTGTIDNPWKNFHESPLAATDGIEPGTRIFFKRGDIWEGPQGLTIASNGEEGRMIVIDAYGDPGDPKPIFRGSSLIEDSWTLNSGETYRIPLRAGVTDPGTVCVDMTYDQAIDEANEALWGQPLADRECPWGTGYALNRGQDASQAGSQTVTTLVRGQWLNNATHIYVRLADGSNPNDHDMYTPTANQASGEFRGLVRAGNAKGAYVSINNIVVEAAQGRGFSLSQPHSEIVNCVSFGTGRDGVLINGYTPNGEMASWAQLRRTQIWWACARGGGHGQPMTCGADHPYFEDVHIENGFMAGFDLLDYSTDTDVRFGVARRVMSKNNGVWQGPTGSFDPCYYVDGATYCLFYDCHGVGGGRGLWGQTANGAGNNRSTWIFGAEHTHDNGRRCHHIEMVNCTSFGGKTGCLSIRNAGGSTDISDITDMKVINCTFVSHKVPATFAQVCGGQGDIDPNVGPTFEIKNTIMWCGSNTIQEFWTEDPAPQDFMDMDYNGYFRTGNVEATGQIHKIGANYKTLAQWRDFTGMDANSVYGNPLFKVDQSYPDDNVVAYNPALKRDAIDGGGADSPMIDQGIPLADVWTRADWVPVEFDVPEHIEGTTKSNGEALTTNDIGYHGPVTA